MRNRKIEWPNRGPKTCLCQSKDWFFITLSFSWSCWKAAFTFFRFSFQRGSGCAYSLGMLLWPFGHPEVHTLVPAGTAQSRVRGWTLSLYQPHITFPGSLWAFEASWGESPSPGQHPGDHNFPVLSDCLTFPFAKQRLSSCLVCRAVRSQIQQWYASYRPYLD